MLDVHDHARTALSVLLVVKKKRKSPVSPVEIAIVNFLPPMAHLPFEPRVQSTIKQAISDPGIPMTEMMV